MGRGVPEILSVVIKNNKVVLDLRYAVAYRVFDGTTVHQRSH